jgi:hypothetical protein
MPLPKRPFVASPEQVRITRDGDDAIIAYADSQIATTHLKMGAERLAAMSDADVLAFWNEHLQASPALRDSHDYVATEIPAGKPQVEYFEPGDQWVALTALLTKAMQSLPKSLWQPSDSAKVETSGKSQGA